MIIKLTQRAEKDLKKLSSEIRDRVFEKFEEIEKHPHPLNLAKKIHSCTKGTFRFRVANDYRIIFRIVHEEIIIARIGHRKNIYKF
jgi:mRNA interferase RelE/StbE